LPGGLGAVISRLFQTRDELSFRNIRGRLWPVLLVFPLSVIMGNLRYYDHGIVLAGFKSSELMLFLLGFGWLILTRIPKRLIIPLLRLAAIICALLLPFQFFMPLGLGRLVLYMAFKFFNGLCAASSFYLFCFALNNVERLAGMALIQLYYGFYYTAWGTLPAVHAAGEAWGGAVVTAAFLAAVFFCRPEKEEINTESDGKKSGVPYVIALSIVHYMIMCMLNYIEWAESGVSSLVFGLGAFVSIGLVTFIQMLGGRNALYIWILFLSLSLLGLGALLYDAPFIFISGSFAYGLGDGLGYIIIYYMCAGAIKLSKSLRMFRLYCLIFFAEYFAISGLFSLYFNSFEGPNKLLAFGVVLVLVSFSFLLMPLMQKKLFDADWTDGLYLRDMEEYSRPFAKAEELNTRAHLNLTDREEEVFTMLLTGMSPKEIAFTLKVSYYTVDFHRKNLYRKLGIQSRAELFSRYSGAPNTPL
jgi:DNA-binding CsgD family transcriptional regulator